MSSLKRNEHVVPLFFPMMATLEPSCAKSAIPPPQIKASISQNGRNDAQHCLEQAIDPTKHSFRTNKVLGHGASAWVEEVVDEVQGDIVAMKVFPAHRRDREKVKARVQEEVDILRKITGNCHIVEFQHAFTDPRGFCILVTPVANYDLAAFYEHCTAEGYVEPTVQSVRKWFSCLAYGLEFIHSHRIRHKDIKPQNILVKDGNVLFADFGLAKDFTSSDGMTSTTEGYTQKTPMYAAPEVHYQGIRRYSADVFSLGCVFAELSSLLGGESVSNFFDFRVKKKEYGIETHAFHDTLDLVDAWLRKCAPRTHSAITVMLSPSPEKRPTAAGLQGLIAATKPELILCNHNHCKDTDAAAQVGLKSSSAGQLTRPVERTTVACSDRSEEQHSAARTNFIPPCPRNTEPQRCESKARDDVSLVGCTGLFANISTIPEIIGASVPNFPDDRARLIADKLDKIAQEVDDMPPSYLLVLLGDEGVGKSALVRSFISGRFIDDYDPTIEDSFCKPVDLDGEHCLLRILDTAGQDTYSSLRKRSLKNGEGFIIVYNIANRFSFDRVTEFVDDIRARKAGFKLPFSPQSLTLVGAKCDLETERCVATQEGKILAQKIGCGFIETSAKLSNNIDKTFYEAAWRVRKRKV